MNYCTYFDTAYLAQGLALHSSMEKHCRPYHLWILALCNRSLKTLVKLNLPNTTIVPMSSFETKVLLAAKATRSRREYYWTCTGSLMLYVLGESIDQLNYIDADCYFFSHPRAMFEEIGDAPLGITPHRFSPSKLHFLSNGIYNVGLVHAKHTPRGLSCIQEWAAQCIDWCYYRNEGNKFADQKYLDTWPKKWGAHAIQHKGANLAPWNQAGQYSYTLRGEQVYIDNDPLIWYHFHQGLDPKHHIHPFVREHIYEPYKKALARVRA